MSLRRAFRIVLANIRRNTRSFMLSSIGLVVGVATFTFFVALGSGIQSGVLERIYPVDQIEVEPRTVGVLGLRETVVDASQLGPETLEIFRALPGVTHIFPKVRSKLQARLWGGKSLFGWDAKAEAFFDGLDPELMAADLRAIEEGGDARRRQRGATCLNDNECPLGDECVSDVKDAAVLAAGSEGHCGPVRFWRRFEAPALVMPCLSDGDCIEGEACRAAACQPEVKANAATPCAAGTAPVTLAECEGDTCTFCAPACTNAGDCAVTDVCMEGACRRMACTVGQAAAQFSDRPADRRGTLRDRCAGGVDPASAACEALPCPGRSYCAPTSVNTATGFCELPIPVVLSPFLVEVFNSSVAGSLGLQPIDGVDTLRGIGFRIQLGNSFFTSDLPTDKQVVRRAEIVGLSDKALDFGVTMPAQTVRRINARYQGRGAATRFDTAIVKTGANQDMSGLIAEMERRGFTLARKSQDARKAADLLFILTLAFSLISLVIMGVAAVNILHTFLMIVSERRHEIGIMRAIGATRSDIRRLILGEALILGLFGGFIGVGFSFLASMGVNALAASALSGIPFKPDTFFVYEPGTLIFGILFACVFCLLGAWLPARRAAQLDPAVVLTS